LTTNYTNSFTRDIILNHQISDHMFGLNKDNAQGQVTELIDRLKSNAGLSDEQATKVIETIKDFVVDKYPMLSGAVNNIFGSK